MPPPPAPLVIIEELDYEPEEVSDLPDIPPDTVAPVVELVGPMTVEVMQLEAYIDQGAAAEDNRDGFLPVKATGVSAVDTARPTEPNAPWLVTYTATDAAGNVGRATRRVHVTPRCVAPSYLCEDLPGDVCATCVSNVTCVCLSVSKEDEEQAVVVEEYAPPLDVTAPVIQLQGDGQLMKTATGTIVMVHRLVLGQAFSEPGVLAWDDVDGDITAAVEAWGMGAVVTTRVTSEEKPFIVTYDVADAAGNTAKQVRRRVYVSSPCGGANLPCADDTCPDAQGRCAGDGEAELAYDALALQMQEEEEEEETAEELMKRQAMPTVTLKGAAVLTVQQGAAYVACAPGAPLSAPCDRGATAHDATDGVLTSRVEACSNATRTYFFKDVGVAGCGVDTMVPGQYNVTFSVTSSSGATAYAVRTLVVAAKCAPSEVLCADRVSCSQAGVCLEDLQQKAAGGPDALLQEPAVDAAPNITLLGAPVLKAVVGVRQHSVYARCAFGQQPTAEVLCEPGAAAMDAEDGNLTARVLACPPASCMDRGCPGHEFASKGLSGCLNTSAPVGATFAVPFVVLDGAQPPQSASVTRTVTVLPPCAAGLFWCAGSGCQTLDCQLSSGLLQADGDAQTDEPPIVSLVGVMDERRSSTSDGAAAGGTDGQTVEDVADGVLTLPYGVASNVSLMPCVSYNATDGDETSLREQERECRAVAWDDGEGDLSAYVTVEQLSPCEGCSGCAVQLVTAGVCPPGVYLYRYAVADLAGNVGEATLAVRLVQVRLPLTRFSTLLRSFDTLSFERRRASVMRPGNGRHVHFAGHLRRSSGSRFRPRTWRTL
jgi:hypothetical protein